MCKKITRAQDWHHVREGSGWGSAECICIFHSTIKGNWSAPLIHELSTIYIRRRPPASSSEQF